MPQMNAVSDMPTHVPLRPWQLPAEKNPSLNLDSSGGRLLAFPAYPSRGLRDRALGPEAANAGRWSGGGRWRKGI